MLERYQWLLPDIVAAIGQRLLQTQPTNATNTVNVGYKRRGYC
jgi:hypothetical protein